MANRQTSEGGGRPRSTSDRLLDVALRLFAERGFRGTTVGDIEEAAGLAPRSGALYKHFESKQALLEAALERHVHEVQTIGDVLDLLPLADLRSELTLLGRWILNELNDERDVTRLIEKEGEQFPELVARMRDHVVQASYEQAEQYARERLLPEDGGIAPRVLAAIGIGALVNYRRTQWTFGQAPGGVSEDEFLDGWVELFLPSNHRDAAGK